MNWYVKKTCGIYCITHKDGKQYIGQSVDCFERFKQHTTSKKGAAGIKGAIMKHGVDEFTFQILEECSRDKLNEREIFYIAEMKTLAPDGYNLTTGGGQGNEVSKETKKKMSASKMGNTAGRAHKGIPKPTFTAEHCDRISLSKMGSIPWNVGVPCSEEVKIKSAEKQRGVSRVHSEEHKTARIAAIKAYWASKRIDKTNIIVED